MFAVIQTGGKQYKVAKNSVIRVEKIKGKQGTKVELNQVLLIGESSRTSFVGTPMVKGAVVTAEIIDHVKEDKILIFKKKRRKNSRRTAGHRQQVTELKILDIVKNKL